MVFLKDEFAGRPEATDGWSTIPTQVNLIKPSEIWWFTIHVEWNLELIDCICDMETFNRVFLPRNRAPSGHFDPRFDSASPLHPTQHGRCTIKDALELVLNRSCSSLAVLIPRVQPVRRSTCQRCQQSFPEVTLMNEGVRFTF